MNAQVRCSNPQCKVAETGKCVEGLSTEKCPDFGLQQGQLAKENSGDQASACFPGIPTSQLLTIGEARELARQRASLLVTTIGSNNAGKTSLIASLYEQFQSGPFNGLSYFWSETLHAFERACHHSRVASKRDVSDTERTKIGSGLKFYHISVHDPARRTLDFLLSDRAGEAYLEASNDPEAVRGHAELTHADAINLLVDGERLADVTTRHNLKSEVRMVLQGIVDSGSLGLRRRLAIVLTKLDIVHASGRKDGVLLEFDQFVDSLVNRHQTDFEEIKAFKVAACPTEHVDLGRGFGVSELLAFWRDVNSFKLPAIEQPEATRYFQRVRIVGGANS